MSIEEFGLSSYELASSLSTSWSISGTFVLRCFISFSKLACSSSTYSARRRAWASFVHDKKSSYLLCLVPSAFLLAARFCAGMLGWPILFFMAGSFLFIWSMMWRMVLPPTIISLSAKALGLVRPSFSLFYSRTAANYSIVFFFFPARAAANSRLISLNLSSSSVCTVFFMSGLLMAMHLRFLYHSLIILTAASCAAVDF